MNKNEFSWIRAIFFPYWKVNQEERRVKKAFVIGGLIASVHMGYQWYKYEARMDKLAPRKAKIGDGRWLLD